MNQVASAYELQAEYERKLIKLRRETGAATSTVDALMYSLRKGGEALVCPYARRRLSELSERQIKDICERLQKFNPQIARPWTPAETAALVDLWKGLRHDR